MHPLTKIFIVLQALLSILVAALVVPLAVNDETWQDRYVRERDARAAAEATQREAQSQLANAVYRDEQERQNLEDTVSRLNVELAARMSEIQDLRSRLASAQQASAGVAAQIDTLTATAETQANIIDTQSAEIARRREESLRLQQRSIELEDQLRDVMTKLDVALDAQRILEQQIAGLNEQLQQAQAGVATANTADGQSGAAPNYLQAPSVIGRVLKVETTPGGEKMAEIDLGSRDGLRENMKLIVYRGSQFLGNLIVSSVDLNRAVGRIELEQGAGVSVNDQVTGGVSFSGSGASF